MWKPYEVNSQFNISSFYSAFVRVCPKEFFFQGEAHDFWELAYVIKGSVCMSVDDSVIELGENRLIFHKPMEFHSMRTDNNKHTELLILSFSASGEFMNHFENSIFTLNRAQRHSIMAIHEFIMEYDDDSEDKFVPTHYLDKISKKPLEFKILKNITENFLISLSHEVKTPSTLIENTETSIYADALRIIDENIYSKLSVDELAKRCNASVSYLKKIFAKYNGLGIHEYILKCKMYIAKQMLSEGASVTEISEKLAFSSQNYFSTAFKRETGISPSMYRQY